MEIDGLRFNQMRHEIECKIRQPSEEVSQQYSVNKPEPLQPFSLWELMNNRYGQNNDSRIG